MAIIYYFILILASILLWPLYPTTVLGRKRKLKKRAIYICNHHSIPDVFVVGTTNIRRLHFMVKKEFYEANFITKALVGAVQAIPIDRGQADLNAFRKVKKYLEQDHKIFIFPEGTRNRNNTDLIEFRNGASLFALRFQADISPMYNLHIPKLFKRNHMIVGDPISFSEFFGAKINSDTLSKCTYKLAVEMSKIKQVLEFYSVIRGKQRRQLRRLINNPAVSMDSIHMQLQPSLPPLPAPVGFEQFHG